VIFVAEDLTPDIGESQKEIRRLQAENKKLERELRYERDLNRRNKAAAGVRESLSKIVAAEKDRLKKYMDLLLTNSSDIILFFDREGHVVFVSDSYLHIRKIQAFSMIRGQSYRELLVCDVEETFLGRVDKMFRTDITKKSSVEFEDDIDFEKNGNRRHYHIQVIPMVEESGAVEGAVFLFHDTTEITGAKIEAERARAVAEQSARAKSDFLSHMSHEIRTPMNAILGMTELLLRKDISQSARSDALEIKRAGGSLLSIINDILDFSKIESGKMEIIPAEYALTSLINDVVNIIRMRIAEKGVLFTVNADASIPGRLIGDELRIRQILLNILSNAAKYTHSGHVAFDIDGTPDDSGKILLRFTVSDTGIGIREEDMKKLFSDFSQIDTRKNRLIEGTGLGLSITRNLCLLMGGEISVKSTYGTGSVFTAVIPQKAADPAPHAAVRDAARKKVLLYGKREVYVDSIARTLGSLGVPCRAVMDLAEFREALSSEKYPFVFLSPPVYEEAEKYLKNSSSSGAAVVLFSSVGGQPPRPEIYPVVMPVYSTSIANALNGETENPVYRENDDIFVNFIAPEARILVVDDIPTNLDVVTGLMSPYGMQVDCCCSGAEAVRLVQENQYDLAFIDHMMPEMDGIDTAAAIRALPDGRGKKLPLIAFTANAMVGMREIFLGEGFNDYLTKPVEIRKLHDILDSWIPKEKRRQTVVREAEHLHLLEGRRVDGVDFAAGMKHFGSEEAFIRILDSYRTHTGALLEKLRGVSEETLKDYAVTVHGIKGASYGISAAAAGKEAETLEFAAKAGDLKAVTAKNGAFIENVERLLSDLDALFADLKANDAGSEPAKPLKPCPDGELLQRMLAASKKYMLSEMEEIMADLERYEYERGADLVLWLRQQVENLEYKAIEQRLESESENGIPKESEDGVKV
jgi:PAS domain S-box-containing protein